MRTPIEKMQAILLALGKIKNYGRKCIGIDPEFALRTVRSKEELDFYYDKLVRRQ